MLEETAEDGVADDGRVGEEPAVAPVGEEPLVVETSGEEDLDTADGLDEVRVAREFFCEVRLAMSLSS